MNALAKALLGAVAAGALLLSVPLVAVSQSQSTTAPDASTASLPYTPILFGMDSGSAAAQAAHGVKADYGTFWIGPWTLTSGWGGPDGQLDAMRNAGVTPAIHHYYWGDDISVNCIENGCYSSLHRAQKDQAGWQRLTDQLVAHLNAKMQGKPVLIFLETEFNKGNVATYEPLDALLAEKATQIKAGYPNAKVVMSLGNWGHAYWGTWDRTAAASDMVGVQGMRGSTRQNEADYATLYEKTIEGAKVAKAKFGLPVVVQDFALSTYPEPGWIDDQEREMRQFFSSRDELHAVGVQALIYRSWRDAPNMDTNNWYGEAERHFGLAWAANHTLKPAGHAWIEGVKAERAGAPSSGSSTSTSTTSTTAPTPPPPPPPIAIPAAGGSAQAEAFAARSAGGAQSDPTAVGGKAWNLWSNGHVQQAFDVAPGTYDVTLRVRGTPLAGTAPHMAATIGAATLAADPGTAYSEHTVRLALGGPVDVRVAFTNDAKSSTEDRNLLVDEVRFVPVQPNRAPAAAFTSAVDLMTVAVDASGSTDADGDALAYQWAFGDGATAVGMTASHTYAGAGPYTVVLTVDDGEAQSAASREVTALQPNRAPSAAFTATAGGLTVSVDGSGSTDADGNPLTYAWSFGDGATAVGKTASHAYAAGGSYAVTLTVSDGELDSRASRTVTVTAPAPTTSTAPYAAKFTVKAQSGEWWQQVKVSASPAPAKVEMSVGGGSWQPMKHRDYGDWTASAYVPKGSSVAFRATAPDGRTATSAPISWLAAGTSSSATSSSSTAPTTSSPAFTAAFTPKAVGNDWWVEVAVSGSQPIAKVEAKVGSGSWTALALQDWGTYAKSVHVPNGSPVAFRATSTSGATVTSAAVTWP